MVYFVGAGTGAEDLITVRGMLPFGAGGCDHLCRLSGKSKAFRIRR